MKAEEYYQTNYRAVHNTMFKENQKIKQFDFNDMVDFATQFSQSQNKELSEQLEKKNNNLLGEILKLEKMRSANINLTEQLEKERERYNRLFDKVNCFTIDLNPEIDEYDNGYNQALENLGNLLKEFLTQNQSKDE